MSFVIYHMTSAIRLAKIQKIFLISLLFYLFYNKKEDKAFIEP